MSPRKMKKITKRITRDHVEEELELKELKKTKPPGQKRFQLKRKNDNDEEDGVSPKETMDETEEREEEVQEQEVEENLADQEDSVEQLEDGESEEGEVIFGEEELPEKSFSPVSFEETGAEKNFSPVSFEEERQPGVADGKAEESKPEKAKIWEPLFSGGESEVQAKPETTPQPQSPMGTGQPLKDTQRVDTPKKTKETGKIQNPSLGSTQRLSLERKKQGIKKETQPEREAKFSLNAEKFGVKQPHPAIVQNLQGKMSDKQKIPATAFSAPVAEKPRKSGKFLALVLCFMGAIAAGLYFTRSRWLPQLPSTRETPSPKESLGWFGEKMPEGIAMGTTRGEYIWQKDQSAMVYVPPGEFWYAKEQIHLPGYYIDKYELSNKQYQRFAAETSYTLPNIEEKFKKPDCPAVAISFADAEAYARWAGKRVPTEQEWAKAARGGLEIPDWNDPATPVRLMPNRMPQRRYPGGEKAESYMGNYQKFEDGYMYTAPVGSFPKGSSPYGCLDMAGNVWEWCGSPGSETCRGSAWKAGPDKDIDARLSPKEQQKIDKKSIGARFACR